MPSHCLLSGSSAWALLDADLVEQTGHKLRVAIPDTAVFSGGVLKAWLYTNSKTGVLQSVPRCQHSIAALQDKLKAPHVAYEAANPDGRVAVAHFSDGLSWLVNAAGLEDLLSRVYVGAVPDEVTSSSGAGCAAAGEVRELQMLQAYVTPLNDERFVTTFGGVEGSTTTTQVRSYSQRYHGPASAQTAQATVLSVLQQAQASAEAAATAYTFHRPSRQRGSVAGSTASLSAGVAVGDAGMYSASVGEGSLSAEDLLRQCGASNGDSVLSSGRGSCSSTACLSVDVGREAVGPLPCAAAHALYGGARDSACETPRLGQTTDGANTTAAAADTAEACCPSTTSAVAVDSWPGNGIRDSVASSEAGQGPSTNFGVNPYQHAGGLMASAQCADSLAGCSSSIAALRFSSSSGTTTVEQEVVLAAPGRVAKAAAAIVQAVISYLDKGMGLRVQGLVAEFIQAASTATQGQQLLLVGLPHLSIDPQQSRGDTATFTERWGEFLAGVGPPPAPAPAQHTSFARTAGAPACIQHMPAQGGQFPAGCADNSSSPGMYGSMGGSSSPSQQQPCVGVFSPLLQPFLQQQANRAACSADGAVSRQQQHGQGTSSSSGLNSLARQVNRQFFPALLGGPLGMQQLGRPGSPDLLQPSKMPGRPLSAPRNCSARPASPLHATRPSTASPGRMRAGALAGFSSNGGSAFPGSRPTSAVSQRPGAGGNPVLRSSNGDSCRLWLQAPQRPSDSLTAQLAAQVEVAKEQVQQYAQAADAAALTAQCAVTEAAQQVSAVQQELLQLRDDAAAAGHERRQLQQQISTLHRQRGEQGNTMQGLQQQLAQLHEQLAQDRETLATMLRRHQEREQQLQEELVATQQQNAELRTTAVQLSSRLEEEGEVVSALRAQLVEYKLMMGQMQLQAKKGRTLHTNNSTMFRSNRPGSATPPGPLGPAGSMTGAGAVWGMQNGVPGVAGGGGVMRRSGSFLSNQLQGLAAAPGVVDGGRAQQQHRISNSDWQTSAIQTALAHRRQQSATTADFGASKVLLTHTAGAASFSAGSHAHTGQPQASTSAAAAARPGSRGNGNSSGASSGSGSASSSARSTQEQATAAAAAVSAGHAIVPAASGGSDIQVLQISGRPGSAPLHAAQHVHMHLPLPLTPANVNQVRSSVAAVGSLQHTSTSTSAVVAQRQAAAAASPSSTTAPGASSLTSAFAQAGASHPTGTHSNSSSPNKGTHPKDVAFSSGPVTPEPASLASEAVQASSAVESKSAKVKAGTPEEVVAEMVSTIAAESSSPLAGPGPEEPTMLIGDMLVDAMGVLDPGAPEQLAVISGLMRGVYGDLIEVYTYYALLGKALVVADRLTLELPQFGKLAYDLHVPQDLVTLSAVEDIFYMLSDRKPCQMLGAAGAHSGRVIISTTSKKVLKAAADKDADKQGGSGSSSKRSSSGGKQAGGKATGSSKTGRGSTGGSSGSAGNGAGTSAGEQQGGAVRVVLPQELIVPEQFPEALVRLACVRYRYGSVNWEYNWDESSDDEDYASYYTDSGAGDATLSPRSARIRQQQLETQNKKGPRVLKPEGANLLRPVSPGAGGESARSPSPTRPIPEPYQLPSETDDLATVVETFLQQEVLKYARRSKLAGSSLGHRRAIVKPPVLQSWKSLPAGSVL